MSIFIKPVADITYQDVVAFCKTDTPEGFTLDYKRTFPSDLEKTLSAFANTYGGVCIIGAQDKDGRPKPPFVGVDYVQGLRERVESIVLSNIHPPFIPEVQVCPPQGGKTFVVVRVDQGIGFHAIHDRTDVYLRTGSINKPETRATVEEVEWLRDRRRKSEVLRVELIRSANERFDNLIKVNNCPIHFCEVTLTIIPVYPRAPYVTNTELISGIQGDRVEGYRGCVSVGIEPNRYRTIPGGILSFAAGQPPASTEVNRYGLILHKNSIRGDEPKEFAGVERKAFSVADLIVVTDIFIEYAGKVYQRLGVLGPVELSVSLEKIHGVQVRSGFQDPFREMMHRNPAIDNRLEWKRVLQAQNLGPNRIETVIDLGCDMAWSLGHGHVDNNRIRKFLENHDRSD